MKRGVSVWLIVLAAAAAVRASGPVGVFAVIEKVVFEPAGTTAADAERVQVWGAFAYVAGGIQFTGPLYDIERGYFYFRLPDGTPAQVQAARHEWADLAAVAGTRQGVAFGHWVAPPQNRSDSLGVMVTDDRSRWVRAESRLSVQKQLPPSWGPALYLTNTGIVKLPDSPAYADVLKRLRDALATKSS